MESVCNQASSSLPGAAAAEARATESATEKRAKNFIFGAIDLIIEL